jgi:hypothetical protein
MKRMGVSPHCWLASYLKSEWTPMSAYWATKSPSEPTYSLLASHQESEWASMAPVWAPQHQGEIHGSRVILTWTTEWAPMALLRALISFIWTYACRTQEPINSGELQFIPSSGKVVAALDELFQQTVYFLYFEANDGVIVADELPYVPKPWHCYYRSCHM